MQAPPPLPAPVLRRVLGIARADGWSVVVVAALGGLYAATLGNGADVATAGLVAAAGAAELHGRNRLIRGQADGTNWLIGAQSALLAAIWTYAWWRWRFFDPDDLWAQLPAFAQAEFDRQLTAAGLIPELDRPPLLTWMNSLTCLLLAVLSLLYQGGLAAYYLTRRRTITEALRDSSAPGVP
jgi:hypothetical protein